jgi:drug/metabolite transporter (DMT)-like permease
MTRTGIAGPQAQRAMVAVGFAITCMFSTIQGVLQKPKQVALRQSEPPAWLTSMAVIAYHVEYVLSFMFVNLISPITYGACDAMRRLLIILSGHLMFGGESFSPLNIAGIGLALLGALAYSITSSGGK